MDSPNSDSRRWRRYPADWAAKLTPAGGASVDVRVVDSGHGGLGLRSCPPLEIGQLIDVALADIGSFPCSVVWQEGDRCGVEFVDLVEPADEYANLFLGGPFAGDPEFDVTVSRNQSPARPEDVLGAKAEPPEASRSSEHKQPLIQSSQADVELLSRCLEDLSRDLNFCQSLVTRLSKTILTRSGQGR